MLLVVKDPSPADLDEKKRPNPRPTTIRYPGSHVIDSAGNAVGFCVHTARDRM